MTEMHVHTTPVLIVGAGPTGLVLALCLAKAGVIPRIIDKKPGTGRESRALGVQARTLEFYRQLGFADQVVSQGVAIETISIRQSGEVAATIDVNRFGAGLSPYPFVLCFPQNDHEQLLVQQLHAAGVAVEWETELLKLDTTVDGVQATLRTADGTEQQCAASYVCGCDGGRSVVRQNVNLGFAGGTSDKTYFVADVVATGEATSQAMAKNAFSFCLSAEDFVLVLPARSSGTHRLIGLVPAAFTGGERVTFADVRPLVEAAVTIRVDTVNWFSTYRVQHRVADHFRAGRVFIAGDAGHIHSPFGGQGMNTGIGDAVNLAWKLAAVVQQRADETLLATYEPERIAFARSLVATTDKMFQLVNGADLGRQLVRKALFVYMLPTLLRFATTRTAVYRRISQTRLNYHTSALSTGQAGAVRGGDRLPWVQLTDGSDNFAPLQACDWQIHVYGAVGAALREAAAAARLPLHQFAWTAALGNAGLARDAVYLIRPDGYVGFAAAGQAVAPLHAYLATFKLRAAHAVAC